MPSFGDTLPEEDRWALAYYVLSLSAFKDPLTGEPLPHPPEDRQALNDPATEAATSDTAYVPAAARAAGRGRRRIRATAARLGARHGLELVPAVGDGLQVGNHEWRPPCWN